MTSDTIIREHHLAGDELRSFFADRRSERDHLEALHADELQPVTEPVANED